MGTHRSDIFDSICYSVCDPFFSYPIEKTCAWHGEGFTHSVVHLLKLVCSSEMNCLR